MSRRALLALLGLALFLGIAVLLVSTSGDRAPGDGELLLPELRQNLNRIEQMTLRAAGNETIATLLRGDDTWVVAEASDYPADVGRIRRNLLALADARIVEQKTANPEFYDRLGVTDIDDPEATGLELAMEADGFSANVIVGDTGVGGGDMAYVRRSGDAQSLMVSADLDLGDERSAWLDREILDISSAEVQAVTIAHPDGETLRIEKPDRNATDFTVLDIPEGRKLSFDTVANSIGAVLSTLQLDDVMTAEKFEPGPNEPVIATFYGFDGLVVETRSWKVTDGVRVNFAFRADDELAERFQAKAASPAAADEQDAPEAPDETAGLQTRATALNQRLGTWVFTLPSFKSDQLTKRLDDLLESDSG